MQRTFIIMRFDMGLREKYGGVVVPMITPFRDDFSVDIQAVEKITLHLIDNGVKPFVLGTTGEGASMSLQQRLDLVKATVDMVNGRQPVFAGISGNSFLTCVEEGKRFADMGVTALVTTIPNYYPMNDAQIMSYCEKLADSVPLPLFLYNIPVTVHRSIPLNILDELSYHHNIAGLKDSERNQPRMEEALVLWKERDDFIYLVGSAVMSVFGIQHGAAGIVPSTGNICPLLYLKLFDEAVKGNFTRANHLLEKINLISGMYQSNRDLSHSLVALKILMSELDLCGTQVLPPLFRTDEAEEGEIRKGKEVIVQLIFVDK